VTETSTAINAIFWEVDYLNFWNFLMKNRELLFSIRPLEHWLRSGFEITGWAMNKPGGLPLGSVLTI
jgi:hypothetical protein